MLHMRGMRVSGLESEVLWEVKVKNGDLKGLEPRWGGREVGSSQKFQVD